MNEASARIKINKLLESAGWRFFADGKRPANIQLEPKVGITSTQLDEFGNDFEKTEKGFVDFFLLNEKGFPFIVLEAKSEMLDPRIGKEQTRKYRTKSFVDENQTQATSDIKRCYENFLASSYDDEEREYPDATDQIREVLVHGHYLSLKDIEICLAYDSSLLMKRPEFTRDNMRAIDALHQSFLAEYKPKDD